MVPLHAAVPYTLPADLYSYRPYKHIEIMEDTNDILQIRDILMKENSSPFVQNRGGIPNFGYSGSTCWVRISMKAYGVSPPVVYLEAVYTRLDDITLYLLHRDGSATEMRGGENVPVHRKDIRYCNPIFRLAKVDLADIAPLSKCDVHTRPIRRRHKCTEIIYLFLTMQ